MDHFQNQTEQSHTYRLKTWLKVLFLLMSVGAVGFSLLFVAKPESDHAVNTFLVGVFSPAMVLLGLYYGISAFRYFVTLDAEFISVGGIFQTRTLRRESVKGFRTVSTRNSSFFVFASKEPGEKSLKITDYFNFDEAWAEWLRSLPNLDEVDSKATLEAIANSPELGETPEVRLQKLSHAKTTSIALNSVAIAAAASLWFLGESISSSLFRALLILLAVLPLSVFWIQLRWPLLFHLYGSKKDPRPTLALVVMVCGFGLLVPSLSGIHTDIPWKLPAYGAILVLILAFLLKSTTQESSKRVVDFVALVLFCCLYGYGFAVLLNTQLDHSQPQIETTEVLEMHTTHGKSTTYYLDLAPWGTSTEPKELSVPGGFFQSVQAGDIICVARHPGALKVSWYALQHCR